MLRHCLSCILQNSHTLFKSTQGRVEQSDRYSPLYSVALFYMRN